MLAHIKQRHARKEKSPNAYNVYGHIHVLYIQIKTTFCCCFNTYTACNVMLRLVLTFVGFCCWRINISYSLFGDVTQRTVPWNTSIITVCSVGCVALTTRPKDKGSWKKKGCSQKWRKGWLSSNTVIDLWEQYWQDLFKLLIQMKTKTIGVQNGIHLPFCFCYCQLFHTYFSRL